MKLPSLFKTSSESSSSSSSHWPWPLPTCGNYSKTLSFRAEHHDNIFKTLNSTYHQLDDSGYSLELFTEYSESSSSYTTTADASDLSNINGTDYIERVIKGLKLEKERLFFEPEASKNINDIDDEGNISNSTFDDVPIFKESVVMALDSKDPFVDFKTSMEEMVEAHGIQDWECLEELLTCYLKVNCKSNHGYIVGAFVDLLVNLAITQNNVNDASSSKTNIVHEEHCSSTSTTSHSFTSPLSFYSSSSSSSSTVSTACLSLLEEAEDDEIIIQKTIDTSVSYLL